MRYGLSDHTLKEMQKLFSTFPEIEQVILFGSRAKGTCKPGSDIDLALKGNEVTGRTAGRLSAQLNEETLLPYFFDVVNFSGLENKDLVEHIERVGVVIYSSLPRKH